VVTYFQPNFITGKGKCKLIPFWSAAPWGRGTEECA